ncbi:MAG: permease-like cell division protein FtsX [bacterium]
MNLGYAFAEAFRSLRRVPLMSTVAVGTISLSLMVFGLFLLVTYNAQDVLQEVRSRVDVEVYLEEGLTGEELAAVRSRITSLPGVSGVRYISKERARERFVADFGDTLLALLQENPLPASYVVSLSEDQRTAAGAERVARSIGPLAGVDEVVFGGGWVDRLDRLILVLSGLSVLIGLVVSLASVFVISNTVKLTVWARREAIQIMKLVGATDRFVRLPFFIEGTIQGLVGAVLALVLMYALYGYAAPVIGGGVVFLPLPVSGVVVLMGGVLGGIGSQVSLKRFLEV